MAATDSEVARSERKWAAVSCGEETAGRRGKMAADGDRNAELSNENKSFADHRVTGPVSALRGAGGRWRLEGRRSEAHSVSISVCLLLSRI